MAVLCKLLMPTGLPKKLQLTKMVSPQQANGYDCGIYCLATAEIVCAAAAEASSSATPHGISHEVVAAAIAELTPDAVKAKRSEWHDLLLGALSSE